MKEELKKLLLELYNKGEIEHYSDVVITKLEEYVENKEKLAFEAGSLYLSEEPVYETFEDYKNENPTEFVFIEKGKYK